MLTASTACPPPGNDGGMWAWSLVSRWASRMSRRRAYGSLIKGFPSRAMMSKTR